MIVTTQSGPVFRLDQAHDRLPSPHRLAPSCLSGRVRYLRRKYLYLAGYHLPELCKRAIDIFAALVFFVVLAPLFAIVALLIKITDGGPVFFRQKRVGRYGKEFDFFKFRSMVVNAEAIKAQLAAMNDHKEGVTFKMKNDPRITWVGRIIRKLSIDELPQLWSVLKGDMTLVGPRPPVPSEVALYGPAERRRLDVKPGLTCIWQVSGRGLLPFPVQLKMDIDYIESRNTKLDLWLLARTVPAVLSSRGAY